MRTDSEIRQDVLNELDSNPKIGSRDIAVAVHDSVVTLAGFVRGFGEKSEAETYAWGVAGVLGLANDIQVRLPLVGDKPDPEIARELVARIQKEMPAGSQHIRVRVAGGQITLRGEVESREQRMTAESMALAVKGVRSISNEIVVEPRQCALD